jgi:hypothetical protein
MSADLTQNESAQLQGRNLTPKVTVVKQAGQDSAIDLFYTIVFD